MLITCRESEREKQPSMLLRDILLFHAADSCGERESQLPGSGTPHGALREGPDRATQGPSQTRTSGQLQTQRS